MKRIQSLVVVRIGRLHLGGILAISPAVFYSFDRRDNGNFQLENGVQIVAGIVSDLLNYFYLFYLFILDMNMYSDKFQLN